MKSNWNVLSVSVSGRTGVHLKSYRERKQAFFQQSLLSIIEVGQLGANADNKDNSIEDLSRLMCWLLMKIILTTTQPLSARWEVLQPTPWLHWEIPSSGHPVISWLQSSSSGSSSPCSSQRWSWLSWRQQPRRPHWGRWGGRRGGSTSTFYKYSQLRYSWHSASTYLSFGRIIPFSQSISSWVKLLLFSVRSILCVVSRKQDWRNIDFILNILSISINTAIYLHLSELSKIFWNINFDLSSWTILSFWIQWYFDLLLFIDIFIDDLHVICNNINENRWITSLESFSDVDTLYDLPSHYSLSLAGPAVCTPDLSYVHQVKLGSVLGRPNRREHVTITSCSQIYHFLR